MNPKNAGEHGYFKRKDADGNPIACIVETCEKPRHSRGYCNAHYQGIYQGQYAEKKPCPIPGCASVIYDTMAMCRMHNKIAWRYSLTVERLAELYLNRYCFNPGCGSEKNLHLDHDHRCCGYGAFGTSHKASCGNCVRGWLCQGCNWALGNMQEDPERIRGLLVYLSERG